MCTKQLWPIDAMPRRSPSPDLVEQLARDAAGLRQSTLAMVAKLERVVPRRLVVGSVAARPLLDELEIAACIAEAAAKTLETAQVRLRLLHRVMAKLAELIDSNQAMDQGERDAALELSATRLRLLLLDCTGEVPN